MESPVKRVQSKKRKILIKTDKRKFPKISGEDKPSLLSRANEEIHSSIEKFNQEFWEDGFKVAFESGELSDLILTDLSNEKTHKVHKIIISRKSDYFKKLIIDNTTATHLSVMDPTGCLEIVLEYLYLGRIRVHPTNIDALLTAAEFYGVQGLTNEIMKVVQNQFSSDKDLIFLYLHHGDQARIACAEYIRANFSDLWEAGCFERLKCTDLSAKELYNILVDDELQIGSEQIVYSAVISYLKKNTILNPDEITLLLSAIRFTFLNAENLLNLFRYWKDYLPPACHDAIIIRLCQHEKLEIPSTLPVPEPRASYAKGVAHNLLSHHLTGGTCRVVEYNFYNGASAYNPGSIEAPPNATWANNGCLMDDPLTKDSSLLSYRINSSIGSTWTNSANTNGAGVLVIDLTQSPNILRTLRRFNIFQMVSDGSTTGVQIYAHPRKTNDCPSFQDEGWVMTASCQDVGPAILDANPPGADAGGNVIRCTSEINVEAFTTRYLKLEIFNNGRNGHPGYIELRQIKGYTL